MLGEVGRYLSAEGLPIAFATMVWILLYDEKAIERARKKNIKRLIYISVFGYFALLILDIIKIIQNST